MADADDSLEDASSDEDEDYDYTHTHGWYPPGGADSH